MITCFALFLSCFYGRAAIPNEIAEAERHGCRQGEVPGPGQRDVHGPAVGRGADHGQAEDQNQQHSQADV